MHEHESYGLWVLVILNSAIFIFFAFCVLLDADKLLFAEYPAEMSKMWFAEELR